MDHDDDNEDDSDDEEQEEQEEVGVAISIIDCMPISPSSASPNPSIQPVVLARASRIDDGDRSDADADAMVGEVDIAATM